MLQPPQANASVGLGAGALQELVLRGAQLHTCPAGSYRFHPHLPHSSLPVSRAPPTDTQAGLQSLSSPLLSFPTPVHSRLFCTPLSTPPRRSPVAPSCSRHLAFLPEQLLGAACLRGADPPGLIISSMLRTLLDVMCNLKYISGADAAWCHVLLGTSASSAFSTLEASER